MTSSPAPAVQNPWPGLAAMVLGFFMIIIDTTIVAVANPAIKAALDPHSPNLDNVVWVTSAYLLAFAVPLLVTGRLGDRFGPKRIYLIGLVIFTLASLASGLAPTLTALIIARAVQGLGAAFVSPQTMIVITRSFPPKKRGVAMSLWGATAGIGTLTGPLIGGFLVGSLGWEWIFFVNVPVGIIAIVLGMMFMPKLTTNVRRFDVLGVALSAVALFSIVFALQEAQQYNWGVIWGPISIWSLLIFGLLLLGVFIWHQGRTKREPLVPLALFQDRSFTWSALASSTVGFTVTSQALPMMFYYQLARDMSPIQAALLMIPMGLTSAALAPYVGRLIGRTDPRWAFLVGITLFAIAQVWFITWMTPTTPLWWFLFPSALMGIGNAGMWGPLATVATRNLPPAQAGAGSGLYTTLRTVASVVGSASIASFMQARIEANLPGLSGKDSPLAGSLAPELVEGFAAAMSQTLMLAAAVTCLGVLAGLMIPRESSAKAYQTGFKPSQ